MKPDKDKLKQIKYGYLAILDPIVPGQNIRYNATLSADGVKYQTVADTPDDALVRLIPLVNKGKEK